MGLTVADREVLVSVRNVSFRYNTFLVLEKVTLDIRPGDFLAVLGPNGSGKTTLLKIILGILHPQEGGVSICGTPVGAYTDWTRVGYVPQKATHIDPVFPASVREVVEMSLRKGLVRRRSDAGFTVEKALELVGLSGLKNRLIGSLSGGQQQRVFIARAIVHRPRLLILDEPTTGVDRETQEYFYEMLHRFNTREGITIVLVTHDIGIVNRHITQVACLNQRLIYHGAHEEFCRSEAFKVLLAGGHLISHQH